MNNKELLLNKLLDLGYKAQMINGIPYILGVDVESAKKIVRSLEYNGTWGVRTGDNMIMSKDEEEEEYYENDN